MIDGQRRYQACQKLNIPTIPAFILKKEPSILDNLSMMFHIHNVRTEWTDFAVAQALQNVIKEMGKDIINLKPSDIKELKRVTSLSEYKLRKYLKFYDYPPEILEKFLQSEKNEYQNKKMDPDILSEMHKPIMEIKKQMPEILKEYSVTKIIDICIKKKNENVVEKNKEFRLISKTLAAAKNHKVRKELVKEKIIEFLNKPKFSPKDVYSSTSEIVYQLEEIQKNSDELYSKLSNFDLRKATIKEKEQLQKNLGKLVDLINKKILQ